MGGSYGKNGDGKLQREETPRKRKKKDAWKTQIVMGECREERHGNSRRRMENSNI